MELLHAAFVMWLAAAPAATPAPIIQAEPRCEGETAADCEELQRLEEVLALRIHAYRERVRAARSAPRTTKDVAYQAWVDAGSMTSLLEDLDQDRAVEDGTLARVSALVPGVSYGPSAVQNISGAVEPEFFATLATTRGDKEAASFFALVARHPPSFWQKMVTDDQACTTFAGTAFVDAYGDWSAFTPRSTLLKNAAVARREAVLAEFLTASCICEQAPTVLEQYQEFLRRFPKDPFAAKVRARMKAIVPGSTSVRLGCTPG